MTFERFAEIIAREFDVESSSLNPDLKLVDDLRWDSLELLRLMLIVEASCPGFELPEQLEMADVWPDVIVGCAGGGSNFAGLTLPFLKAKFDGAATRIVAVEPSACPTLTKGSYAYDFEVGERAGMVVGAIGVERYGDYGLLRSAVVTETERGSGLGARLTRERLDWGRAQNMRSIYLLTTTAAPFFERIGFARIDRHEVPAEVQAAPEFATICPASAVVMRRACQ